MAPQGNSRTSVNLEDIANLVGMVTKETSLLNNKRSYKTVTPFFNMSPQVRRRGQGAKSKLGQFPPDMHRDRLLTRGLGGLFSSRKEIMVRSV